MLRLPDYPLSAGTTRTVRAAVAVTQLGDGYVQTAAAQPDNLLLEVTVRYAARRQSEISALDAFLRARGGSDEFVLRLPDEAADRHWRCEEWRVEVLSAELHTLVATLLEVR